MHQGKANCADSLRPVALISSNASPRCVANDARPQGLDGTPRPAQAQPLSAPSRGKLKPSRPSERDNRSFREFRRQERQSTRQDLGGAAINLPAVGGKTDAVPRAGLEGPPKPAEEHFPRPVRRMGQADAPPGRRHGGAAALKYPTCRKDPLDRPTAPLADDVRARTSRAGRQGEQAKAQQAKQKSLRPRRGHTKTSTLRHLLASYPHFNPDRGKRDSRRAKTAVTAPFPPTIQTPRHYLETGSSPRPMPRAAAR